MHGSSWWPTSDGAPPRYATRRNPSLTSDGAQVEVIARALGTPLLPWQSYVADVAGERRPDGSYEHQVVIVTVPRQSGKTTLIRALGAKRALTGRDFFYTAQTGKDARARWEDLVKALRLSPAFRDRIDVKLRGGSEHVLFPGGGRFQAFAPTAESLHGYTPPGVCLDEAFAHSADSGNLLMGAIEPAQQTVVDRQLWIISTMGTAESVFLHDWIDRARGGMARVALFDWGASDEHDPFSLDDIAAFHPTVGQTINGKTMTAADILSAADKLPAAEYVRAYANRSTLTTSNLIPPDRWRALLDDQLLPPADPRDVLLAYDVDEHNQGAAIVGIWTDQATGKPAAKVIEYREGSASWLADAIDDLAGRWRTGPPIAVGNGPVLDVTAQLRARGLTVDELSEREFAAATTGLLALVDDQQLLHDGGERLAASVTGLTTRAAVVDGVAFSRRHSAGSSAAAIALTAGLHRHRHQSAAVPLVRFAS